MQLVLCTPVRVLRFLPKYSCNSLAPGDTCAGVQRVSQSCGGLHEQEPQHGGNKAYRVFYSRGSVAGRRRARALDRRRGM